MARTTGPRETKPYSKEFKVTAVKLSAFAGVFIKNLRKREAGGTVNARAGSQGAGGH
jgi:hypothetical protein